jgi:predicted secreted protein
MFGPHPGGPFMQRWKIVTGAPYSATANYHLTQTLVGGNTIDRTTTQQLARDSQGRTYTKETLPEGPWAGEGGGSKTVIFINDPVAGYSYVLHPDKKIAIRRPEKIPPEAQTEHAGSLADNRKGPSEKEVSVTDLGSKEISGAGTAQGKSITHTIPAGRIGNAQPIVSTGEVWRSPDLQIVVAAKHNDPRNGESVYTLSNVQRGEPNASLFQVPSDYTIKDVTTMHDHPGPPE